MKGLRPHFLLCATFATLATLTVSAAPRIAFAQTPSVLEDARQHYKRGIDLYGEANYTAALIEFRRAYDAAPNGMILYNIAQVHYQLHEYPQALKAFEAYLQDGGAKVPAPRRAEVEKLIAYLRERVGYVEVKTNAEGAELSVDGVPAGHTPLTAPLIVVIGRRRIELLRNDRVLASKQIDVAANDHLKLTLDEQSTTAPVAGVPDAPRDKPVATTTPFVETSPPYTPPADRGPWPAVAWTTAGVLAAGTVVTGILALGAAKDLKNERTTDGATRDDLDSAQSKTKTLALVTDIVGIGTVVAVGAALYLTLTKPQSASAGLPLGLRAAGSNAMLTGRF